MSPRWSRRRGAVLVATTVVALAALLQPAAAQARPVGATRVGATRVGAALATPGAGSYLALVDKGHPSDEGLGLAAKSESLVLVNQAGVSTTLMTRKVTKVGDILQLRDWSADGSTALLVLPNRRGEQVIKVDVATGATQTMKLKGDIDATFLDPDGAGIVASFLTNSRKGLETWERISWAGAVTPLSGKVFSTLLPGPGETVLAGNGASRSLVVRSLVDGSLVKTIPTHGSCSPVRWWSASQVLVTCGRTFDLFLLDPTSGAMTQLTSKHGQSDYGHLDARQVASGLYVQVAGPCGYTFVAKQTSTGSIKALHFPHAVGNIVMIDATATDLVLEHAISCDGGLPKGALTLYDPVAKHETPFYVLAKHEAFSTVLTFGNVGVQY